MPGTPLDKHEGLSSLRSRGQADKQARPAAGKLNPTVSVQQFPDWADVGIAGTFFWDPPLESSFQ